MADSFTFTKFPNHILDNLHTFSGSEFKVIGFVTRQLYGHSMRYVDHRFAVRWVAGGTGLDDKTANKVINELLDKDRNVFYLTKTGALRCRHLILNIKELNFTRFPNYILDKLPELSGIDFLIAGFMVRQLLGYPGKEARTNHEFSARYIQSKLGISLDSVVRGLDSLEKHKIIAEIGRGKRGVRLFGLPGVESTMTVPKIPTMTVPKIPTMTVPKIPTIQTDDTLLINKEINKRNKSAAAEEINQAINQIFSMMDKDEYSKLEKRFISKMSDIGKRAYKRNGLTSIVVQTLFNQFLQVEFKDRIQDVLCSLPN